MRWKIQHDFPKVVSFGTILSHLSYKFRKIRNVEWNQETSMKVDPENGL